MQTLLILLIIVGIMIALSSCTNDISPISKAADRTEKLLNNDKMFYLKQVIEHSNTRGHNVTQYFETWVASKQAKRIEIDSEGQDLRVALDKGGQYISYDAQSLTAQKYELAQVQFIDLSKFKSSYVKTNLSGEKKYAGRDCEVYLLENEDADDWVQLYVDKETGWVLFCDAPLFRIRTADHEVLAIDNELFSVPVDLIYN